MTLQLQGGYGRRGLEGKMGLGLGLGLLALLVQRGHLVPLTGSELPRHSSRLQ